MKANSVVLALTPLLAASAFSAHAGPHTATLLATTRL